MKPRAARSERPALDPERLERLALRYVERYATTRAKLAFYLRRKLRERGWAGCDEPGIEALVERFAARGYVDDRAFAEARSEALGRRGYGARRVGLALRAAGIADGDGEAALVAARERGWESAIAFARRKRIGAFATALPDERQREKAFASMLRAGHSFDFARLIVDSRPGEPPPAPN